MATNGTPKDLGQQQAMNSNTMQELNPQSQKQEENSVAEVGDGLVKTQNTNAEKGGKLTANQTDTKDKPSNSPLAAESNVVVEQKVADPPVDNNSGNTTRDAPSGSGKDDKIQERNSESATVNENAGDVHAISIGALASSDLPPSMTSPPLKLPPPGLRINPNIPPPNVEGIPGDYWYVSYQLNKSSFFGKKKWYGAEGRFSTFRPKLEKGDHSILQMAIVNDNGNADELQTVETGWRRSSTESGPYFFSYTTNMGYKPSKPTDRK